MAVLPVSASIRSIAYRGRDCLDNARGCDQQGYRIETAGLRVRRSGRARKDQERRRTPRQESTKVANSKDRRMTADSSSVETGHRSPRG